MASEIILLARARRVAAERHVDQRRRGERAVPHVNHLAEVPDLVDEATNGSDPNLVGAAVLHDTIEDTGLAYAELQAQFGTDVADLVAEVTDDKQLTSSERKKLQVEQASHISTWAKMLKLADKTSNLRSIANSPPPDWSGDRSSNT